MLILQISLLYLPMIASKMLRADKCCSPLPNPLPNYVLGVDSTNGCDAGLKMNYDTRCDVQCDTSLGYEAGTGYYECPENGGDPILNINCQQASCEVNQRVLNGACVACPPGT